MEAGRERRVPGRKASASPGQHCFQASPTAGGAGPGGVHRVTEGTQVLAPKWVLFAHYLIPNQPPPHSRLGAVLVCPQVARPTRAPPVQAHACPAASPAPAPQLRGFQQHLPGQSQGLQGSGVASGARREVLAVGVRPLGRDGALATAPPGPSLRVVPASGANRPAGWLAPLRQLQGSRAVLTQPRPHLHPAAFQGSDLLSDAITI